MLALFLVVAAALEVGGDAAIRHGLMLPSRMWLLAGMLLLGTYGWVVNLNRGLDFSSLMGLYIVVFFVVSQVLSVVVFGERLAPNLLIGGTLIVGGGLVIQFGGR